MVRGRTSPAQRREAARLPAWQRRAVYASTALLLGSGLLWLLFHYAMAVDSDFGPRPHPWTYFWLQLHGAAAMLALIVLGSMLPAHALASWRQRKNRAGGVLLGVLLGALVVTGWLLYYAAGESSRSWISALHWGLGLGLAPLLAWHAAAGLRLRQRAHHPRASRVPLAPATEQHPADQRLH